MTKSTTDKNAEFEAAVAAAVAKALGTADPEASKIKVTNPVPPMTHKADGMGTVRKDN